MLQVRYHQVVQILIVIKAGAQSAAPTQRYRCICTQQRYTSAHLSFYHKNKTQFMARDSTYNNNIQKSIALQTIITEYQRKITKQLLPSYFLSLENRVCNSRYGFCVGLFQGLFITVLNLARGVLSLAVLIQRYILFDCVRLTVCVLARGLKQFL